MDLKNDERIEQLGLNGLKIIQSSNLYRFTSDAVLLTKFASAKKNDVVADFCAGSGIVGLHFYALNPSCVKSVDAFELQPALADMCERTVELNGLQEKFKVHNVAIQEISNEFNGKFSLILCNPPYEKPDSGEKSLSESDRIARHEIAVTLKEIVTAAAKNLKYGGRLCMAHRADRLVDVLCEMRANGLEPKRIKFISAKDKAPYLMFAEGVKGGKPCVKIEPQFYN